MPDITSNYTKFNEQIIKFQNDNIVVVNHSWSNLYIKHCYFPDKMDNSIES